MTVLLLGDVSDGQLSIDATAKALTAAKMLGEATVLCGLRFGGGGGRASRKARRRPLHRHSGNDRKALNARHSLYA